MTGFIYKITNDINEHLYIGKTVLTIEKRFLEHIKESKKDKAKNRPLYSAIRKYGAEHFSIHLIEECDIDALDDREKYWIDVYQSYKNGYNATLGGDGSLLYDYDVILKMYKDGMLVHEITEYIGCERSVVQRCLKRSKVNSFKNSIEKSRIPVYMCAQDETILQYFNSQSEAAQWLIDCGYSNANKSSIRTNIGRVVDGKRQTAYGYKWKNKTEDS